MEYENKMGRPLLLTDEVYKRIIENVPKGLRPETIANLSLIPPPTLRRWLKQGLEDAQSGKYTLFAQFWLEFNQKKAEKVIEWLEYIQKCLPNWQALWELIRAVAREDFGQDSIEFKDLLDQYKKLSEDFKRYTENPLARSANHGKELDQGSDKEERLSSQRIGCEERQEDPR